MWLFFSRLERDAACAGKLMLQTQKVPSERLRHSRRASNFSTGAFSRWTWKIFIVIRVEFFKFFLLRECERAKKNFLLIKNCSFYVLPRDNIFIFQVLFTVSVWDVIWDRVALKWRRKKIPKHFFLRIQGKSRRKCLCEHRMGGREEKSEHGKADKDLNRGIDRRS